MSGNMARAIWGIPVVASATERDQRFPSPERDQRVHLRTTGEIQRYDGAQWVTDSPGALGTLPEASDSDLTTATLTLIFTSPLSKALRLNRLAGYLCRIFGMYVVLDPKFGGVGTGVASDRAAILATEMAAAAGGGAVYFPGGGTYLFDGADKIFGVPFVFGPGAILKVAAGTSVYVKQIGDPLSKVFDATQASDATKGTVYFNNAIVSHIRPEWWGALSDGSTDDTKAIQSAIDASAYNNVHTGPPIEFSAGVYRYTTLDLLGSIGAGLGMVLRGAGRYATILETTSAGVVTILANSAGAGLRDLQVRTASSVTPVAGQVLFKSITGSAVTIEHVDFDWYYKGVEISGVAMNDCNFGLLSGGVASGTSVYLPDAVGTTLTRVIVNIRANGHTGFHIASVAGQPDTNIFIFCGTNRFVGSSGVSVKMTRSAGNPPRWTRFTNCAFETTENGSGVNCVEYASGWNTVFTSCYILGGQYGFLQGGAVADYIDACRLIGTIIFGASQNGVLHSPSNTGTYGDTGTKIIPALSLIECDVVENSQAGVGTAAGVSLGANSRGFTMKGGSVGRPLGNTAVVRRHSYGIEVTAGATDFDIDIGSINLLENVTGPHNGLVPTVASAATITPTTPMLFVSGTAAIGTITLPQRLRTFRIIPTGVFTWTAAGNIALAGTAVVSKLIEFNYSDTTAKWYPSYV